MTDRLKDKVAIVTGAGQGIGEAITRAFIAEGAQVVIAERNAETGQRVAGEIGAVFLPCDVTVQADVERVVHTAEARFGRIDVLVNNAGANVFHRPLDMPRSEWARCMALDLEAAWAMAEAVLPGMRKRGAGSIVNIASTHGFKIIPHTFPYPVAKHGLIGLTRSLGIEFAAEGIRVNAILPGPFITNIAGGRLRNKEDRAAFEAQSLIGRIGDVEDIKGLALLLASPAGAYFTGSLIVIDGGSLTRMT